jgi:hypothetical protein
MDVRLISVWMVGRNVFMLDIEEFIHHKSVSINRGPLNVFFETKSDFFEDGYNDFDYISLNFVDHISN